VKAQVVLVDTHTDGQNFIEENGCMAVLQLARHFASLPPGQGCAARWSLQAGPDT
jgi:hypothetical protein